MKAQVKWSRDGEHFVHATTDATVFVRRLLAQYDDIGDLEVKRAMLEDTYLALVHQEESGSDRRIDPLALITGHDNGDRRPAAMQEHSSRPEDTSR